MTPSTEIHLIELLAPAVRAMRATGATDAEIAGVLRDAADLLSSVRLMPDGRLQIPKHIADVQEAAAP